jgi:hypothetical protein
MPKRVQLSILVEQLGQTWRPVAICPPRVQKYATRVAIELHDILYTQDSIHRDAINQGPPLDPPLV